MNNSPAKKEQDIQVGIFVSLGLAFSMVAILVLGGSESMFTRKTVFTTHLPNASGLLPGAKVVLSGINVGSVRSIDYDRELKNVKVTLAVAKRHADNISDGSMAEIMTQGVLGDKFISLTPGNGTTALPENAEIPNAPTQDLSQILSKSDNLMMNLSSAAASLDRLLKSLEKGGKIDAITEGLATTSKNMAAFSSHLDGGHFKKASRELAQILEKINSGSGTIGALVNDAGLYEDARALVGGANRNRIIRNLVRKTAKDGIKEDK